MTKKPLKKEEIEELVKLLRDFSCYLNKLRDKNPLAKEIQYPKIPVVLSESIALYAIMKNKILEEEGIIEINFFSKKVADILAKNKNGQEVKIEVKSTGEKHFQELSKKDKSADYFIWIDFGDVFKDPIKEQIVDIYFVKEPSKYFNEQDKKMSLKKFKEKIGDNLKERKLDLTKLQPYLPRNPSISPKFTSF